MAIMSDSSIALNPVIDEPSNPMPCSSASESSSLPTAKLFSWPRMSVNQKRMNSTPSSSTRASTSFALVLGSVAVAICLLLLCGLCLRRLRERRWESAWSSDRRSGRALGPAARTAVVSGRDLLLRVGLEDFLALLARADSDRLIDGDHEDLAVTDIACACVLEDGLDHHGLVLVLDHALQLQLGAHVHGQGRASVVLHHPLLAPRSLGLEDRQGGESPVEQLGSDRLERLVADVCLDLLHPIHPLPRPRRGCRRPSASQRPRLPAPGRPGRCPAPCRRPDTRARG